MQNNKPEVDANQAKDFLDIIDQQNVKAANLARMPIWLNIMESVLFAWVIFYEFITYTFDAQIISKFLLLCIILVILIYWTVYLRFKGLKQKWFPLNRLSLFAFSYGFLGAMFGSEMLVFLSETIEPMLAYFVLLLLFLSMCYFINRFPLTEYVPRNA